MNIDSARKLYPEAKQLAGLVSDEWTESYDTKNSVAQICVRDSATGEVDPIANVLPSCSFDDRILMTKAPVLIRALVAICERSFEEIRRLKPKEKKKFTEANRCGKWCHDNFMFARWLTLATGLHDASDAERIKTHVRFLLKVESLSEIDTKSEAAGAWRKMRSDFEAWNRSQNANHQRGS